MLNWSKLTDWRSFMNPEITPDLSEAQPEKLLPWHQPEVQRLTVSLDTSFNQGSNTDLNGGSTLG
jgi:hypothetical protein